MSNEMKIYSEQDLTEILSLAKNKEDRDYMLFLLLICTGMRLEECLTIKIENVDLKQCIVKTTFNDINLVDYFFPSTLEPLLTSYIEGINQKSPWIFPERDFKSHLTSKSIIKYVKKEYNAKYAKFERFRNTLIAGFKTREWLDHEIINAFFHYKDVSINAYNLDKLRYYYDRAFPFYYLIID
ncbi:MAG: tyrosine-type recombinase/integrase [Promethearchaeota archaeon]